VCRPLVSSYSGSPPTHFGFPCRAAYLSPEMMRSLRALTHGRSRKRAAQNLHPLTPADAPVFLLGKTPPLPPNPPRLGFFSFFQVPYRNAGPFTRAARRRIFLQSSRTLSGLLESLFPFPSIDSRQGELPRSARTFGFFSLFLDVLLFLAAPVECQGSSQRTGASGYPHLFSSLIRFLFGSDPPEL